MNAGSHRVAAVVPSSEWAARPLASGEPVESGQEVHRRRSLGLSVLRRPAGGSGSAGIDGEARCLMEEQEQEGLSRFRQARCVNGKKEQPNYQGVVLHRRHGRSVFQRSSEERRAWLSRCRYARGGKKSVVRGCCAIVALVAGAGRRHVPSFTWQLTPPSSGQPSAAAHVER